MLAQMAAGKTLQGHVLHPNEQAPVPPMLESEAAAEIGRGAGYLREGRASGGLDDDPTASGSPVMVRKSYRNLKGGR